MRDPFRCRITRCAAVAAGLLWIATAASAEAPWADLRNEAVRHGTSETRARGRERLRAAAERHGLERWRRASTLEIVATDVWPRQGPWWPAASQRLRLQSIRGSFTARVELLDGPAAGEIWGLQSWAPYKVRHGRLEFLAEPDYSLQFYLPSLGYFNELPFRLLDAEHVFDAGPTELAGRRYQLVFATWGSLEPSAQADHYMVWIGAESGLVEKVHYTVREAVALAPPERRDATRQFGTGTLHLLEFRTIEGLRFPFRHVVTLFGPEEAADLETSFVHRLEVESLRLDAVPAALLLPDAARGDDGDRKPPPLR